MRDIHPDRRRFLTLAGAGLGLPMLAASPAAARRRPVAPAAASVMDQVSAYVAGSRAMALPEAVVDLLG